MLLFFAPNKSLRVWSREVSFAITWKDLQLNLVDSILFNNCTYNGDGCVLNYKKFRENLKVTSTQNVSKP